MSAVNSYAGRSSTQRHGGACAPCLSNQPRWKRKRSSACPDWRVLCCFPAPRGGYLDLHNFRAREWRPAQLAAGIEPVRRPYDLRHTYATFALRAGVSIFDLSRFMGASLAMIDRHYGHLARDGREHAVALLDAFATETAA